MFLNPRKRLDGNFIDALDVLRIELAAVTGRWRLPKQISTQDNDYLQLGCGSALINGFLNTDYFTNTGADAWIDMRYPLRFPKNTWRGVYAHHAVEHIGYDHAYSLFREIHRVLRPGGIFRMVVPNLEAFLRCYSANDGIFRLLPDHHRPENIVTPLEMTDHMFRDTKFNRHLSSWDWDTAKYRLADVGFNVVRQSVNVSIDPRLAGHDNPGWEAHSLYVEAVKD